MANPHHEVLSKHGWNHSGGPGYQLYTHSDHPDHYVRVKDDQWVHGKISEGGGTVVKAGGKSSLSNHLEKFHSTQHTELDIQFTEAQSKHITDERAEELVSESRFTKKND